MTKPVPIVSCLIITVALGLAGCDSSKLKNSQVAGFTDLAGIDLSKPIALNGNWELYQNRFVEPSAFSDHGQPLYDAVRGVSTFRKGYATWHLKMVGLKPYQQYGFTVSWFPGAAVLYGDGSMLQSYGVPSRLLEDEIPGWASLVVPLHSGPDGVLDIVIHCSSSSGYPGGFRPSITFGEYGAVTRRQGFSMARELFFIGMLSASSLFALVFRGMRRSENLALWFGFLCASIALRLVCQGEYFIIWLFPDMPSNLLFLVSWSFMALSLAMFACVVYCSVRKGLWKRRSAWLLVIVSIIFSAGLVHSGLSVYGLAASGWLSMLGMAAVPAMLSFLLARHYTDALSSAENQSVDLTRVNGSFERFVPVEFLGFLGRDSMQQVQLGDSIAREMAVLFVDIRDFSRLAESATPQETFAFINEYLARVGPAVRDFGGFVDKYLGDGFLALFPASTAAGTSGVQASLDCALEMQKRVATYNADRAKIGQRPIRVGFGLHAGPVMLGTIGEERRMDGTVISDAVNIASRLETVSKQYGLCIAVTERIVAGLPDPTAYRMRFIGKVRVKGKAEPVSVFEVYEGDSPDLRSKKDLVRALFERGVEACHQKRHGDARALFAQVLAVMPEDGATQRYLESIESHDPR